MLHDTLIAIEKASCEVQTWVTHGGVRATASTEVSEIERELTSIWYVSLHDHIFVVVDGSVVD